MAMMSSLSNLLKGSGWTSALTKAGVVGPGVAECVTRGSQLNKTR